MKYKCNNCGWTGYNLVSGGGRDGEPVCPNCKSERVEKINENTPYDSFSDPEGDMRDNYYNNMGSGMA